MYLLTTTLIKKTRINDQIKVYEVQLVLEGQAPKIMSTDEARAIAESESLDLVEVNPNSTPPLCKLMDYGKYLYKKKKQEQEAKKKSKPSEVKTIRFSFRTSDHDLENKKKQTMKFLDKGSTVKFHVVGRGRELAYKQDALEKVKKFVESLQDIAIVDQPPKIQGNTILAIIRPIKKS